MTTKLTPNMQKFVTPWVAYTPTFTGVGLATNVEFFSRRVGDTLEVEGKFTCGTTTGVEMRVSLGFNGVDSNVVISGTKVPSGNSVSGVMTLSVSGNLFNMVLKEPSVGYMTFGAQSSSFAGLTKMNGNTHLASGYVCSISAKFPIQGW